MPRAIRWTPVDGIDASCAEVSFTWHAGKRDSLQVLMHFCCVVGGKEMDLLVEFDNPCALEWEDETFGLIPIAPDLPRLDSKSFAGWTFPMLIIEESPWAEKYAANRYAANDPEATDLKHYVMISLNDIVHVLSIGTPRARWLQPTDI